MGIPSYFSYIIKNYKNIVIGLKKIKENGTKIDNLYMDCNSIIYDAISNVVFDENIENNIIKNVVENIEKYIQLIKPSDTVLIAFDGVAPLAKMKQQKTRRYKTHFMSKINLLNGDADTSEHWNTSKITPGTDFMNNLSEKINFHFNHGEKEKEYNIKKIIVSTSKDYGEGEHKIFEYIRINKETIKNQITMIYGLDSDLIMLSILHCHLFENIFIFREAPEFLKSSVLCSEEIDENEHHYVLDVNLLKKYVIVQMNCDTTDFHRIYDYVFLCFLLGNDFLPHFPAINIRRRGIDILLNFYCKIVKEKKDFYFISKNDFKIKWRNFNLFIKELAKYETEFIIEEYALREKNNEKKNYDLIKTKKEKEQFFQNIPIIYRQEENYICPIENKWEERYYKILFQEERNNENLKKICKNYMEGLEWTLRYYIEGCPNYRWCYNYNYPPLLFDLKNYIPDFEKQFITENKKPFSANVQLAFVMTKENSHLLPTKIQKIINDKYSFIYGNNEIKFSWAFCRYFWETHVCFQKINLNILEKWDREF